MVRKLKNSSSTSSNQNDIVKQAQAMQLEMLKIQEELGKKELEVSVGGGAVVVKVTGQQQVLDIKLSDDIIKEAQEDKEMLQDLIVSAISEAMRQAEELSEGEMSKLTGGLSIPGLF